MLRNSRREHEDPAPWMAESADGAVIVAAESGAYLGDEVLAEPGALRAGGWIPLGDDEPAPGINFGDLRRRLRLLGRPRAEGPTRS